MLMTREWNAQLTEINQAWCCMQPANATSVEFSLLKIQTFSLRGVLTFVASGLDINGCVLSYFDGNGTFTLLYKLYTHYFTL